MENPTKADITAVLKKLRHIPTNKQCFDCGSQNPTWASVTYGVFLCIDCSAVHRSLGVHLTFIRSTQLDTSWTWQQLRAMQVGGNANALAFFRQHGCTTNDAQQKYNSRAANMYKEKLSSMANRAMQLHGTKLHINASGADASSPPADTKEVDFFKQHEEFASQRPTNGTSTDTQPNTAEMNLASVDDDRGVSIPKPKPVAAEIDPSEGPSVDAALSVSPTQAALTAEPRKPTIGARKPMGAKKAKSSLGARKGGLGAQRVKTNFNDIENAAHQKDKDRETMAANMEAQEKQRQEDEEKKMASMRLAYQDLSLERKKQEAKLKNVDPKKAEQMQRLGMGMTGSRLTSHSAMSDMKQIEQSGVTQDQYRGLSSANRSSSHRLGDQDDDFEVITRSSGSSGLFDDSPFSLRNESRYSSNWGGSGSSNTADIGGAGLGSSSSNWDRDDSFSSKKSSIVEDIPTKQNDHDTWGGGRSRSTKTYDTNTSSSASDDAQKKFGTAKSISSDQYFGNSNSDFASGGGSSSRFEGSTGISSDMYFNRDSTSSRGGGSGSYSNASDLSDIKEGVRQGVTKVAGKLSMMANGVMNSLQEQYG